MTSSALQSRKWQQCTVCVCFSAGWTLLSHRVTLLRLMEPTLSICCYCIYFNVACHIITVICHQAATSLRCNWLCTRPPLSLHYLRTSLVSHTLLFPRYPRGNSAMVNATAEFEGAVDFPVGILGSDFIFVKAFIL